MKRLFLTSLLLLFGFCVLSQRADSIWYFGDHAGIDFTSGIPVSLSNGQMQAYDNTSTISDFNGNLLFYTNGVDVWDKNHNIMPNGNNLGGSLSSGQSVLIVPQPLTSFYYIFTVGYASSDAFRYSIVDMTLNGGNGDVTTKANIIFNGSTEKLDAIYNFNDTSYWVITHSWNSNQFYSYKINSNGLNLTPVISAIGSTLTGGSPSGYNAIGQMSFSDDGSKLVNGIYDDGLIEVFDFNIATGTLSNYIGLSGFTKIWGVAFSNNNQFLYFTEWFNDKVWQLDISSGVSSSIIASKTLVGTGTFPTGSSGYKIGYFQNAPDSKIYIAKFGQHYISAINNPNLSGTNCNFVDNAVNLGAKVCNAGLSRTIRIYGWINNYCSNNYYDTAYICTGDSININGVFYSNQTIVIDTLIDNAGCDSIVTTSIFQNPLPIVDLGNDTSFCDGDSILISVNHIYSSILWSNGSNSDSIYVSNNGVYWVTVNDSFCSNTDTINILNISHSYIKINDTTICNDESLKIILPTQNSYIWNTGITNNYITIIDSGLYSVQISDICKTYIDSFFVEFIDCGCKVAIANVFTPNNDGINEIFHPIFDCEIKQYQFNIFNRWGKLIFSSNSPNEAWDGKYLGIEVPDGVYFYIFTYENIFENGQKTLKGSVTIFR